MEGNGKSGHLHPPLPPASVIHVPEYYGDTTDLKFWQRHLTALPDAHLHLHGGYGAFQ